MLKQALGASGHVAGLAFLEIAVAQSSPTHRQDGDPLKWSVNCHQKTPPKPYQQLVMFTECIPCWFDVRYRNRAGSRNKHPGLPLREDGTNRQKSCSCLFPVPRTSLLGCDLLVFSFCFDGGAETLLIQTSQGHFPSKEKQAFKSPLKLRRVFNRFSSFLGKDSTYREGQ